MLKLQNDSASMNSSLFEKVRLSQCFFILSLHVPIMQWDITNISLVVKFYDTIAMQVSLRTLESGEKTTNVKGLAAQVTALKLFNPNQLCPCGP